MKTKNKQPLPDFAADAANQTAAGNEAAKESVHNLYIALLDQLERHDSLSRELKDCSEKIIKLQETLIPEAMTAEGADKVAFSTGDTLSLKDIIRAGIPTESAIEKQFDPIQKKELSDRRKAALAFIRKTGGDAIIANEVTIELGKLPEGKVKEAIKKLEKLQLGQVQYAQSVHPQTLLAWLRETLAKLGNNMPEEAKKAFGLYQAKAAVLKIKKQ